MADKQYPLDMSAHSLRDEFGLLHVSSRPKARAISESERAAIDNAARNSEANAKAYLRSVDVEMQLRKEGKTKEAEAIEATRELHLDLF